MMGKRRVADVSSDGQQRWVDAFQFHWTMRWGDVLLPSLVSECIRAADAVAGVEHRVRELRTDEFHVIRPLVRTPEIFTITTKETTRGFVTRRYHVRNGKRAVQVEAKLIKLLRDHGS